MEQLHCLLSLFANFMQASRVKRGNKCHTYVKISRVHLGITRALSISVNNIIATLQLKRVVIIVPMERRVTGLKGPFDRNQSFICNSRFI